MPRIVFRSSAKLLLGAACVALLAGCMDKSPDTQLDWGVYNHGWPDSGPVDQPTASDAAPQYSQDGQNQTFQVAQNSDNDPTPPPPANYHAPDQDGVQVSSLGTVSTASAPAQSGMPTEEQYANAPIHREKATGTEPPHSPYASTPADSGPRTLSKPGTGEMTADSKLAREAAAEAAARAAPAKAATKKTAPQKVAEVTPPPKHTKTPPAIQNGVPVFHWPVQGKLINRFGENSGGTENDGINIATREGDPIHAAAAGTVEYAGSGIAGYGNLVLIRHADNYFTAYAHADKLNVQKGDKIRVGQVIGYAGQSGDVTTPQLHFEIRHGKTPLDPTHFLKGSGS